MTATAKAPSVLPISVVIPAHNRAASTVAAVASAFAQRPLPPAEVIVVDDCSSDGTAAAAEGAGARVVRREQNGGEAAARNTGVEAATQPWIAPLDSDDLWFSNHLDVLWQAASAGDEVLLSTSALACGEDPEHDHVWGSGRSRARRVRSPSELVPGLNFFVLSGAMVRRDVVLAAGGFPLGMKRCGDYDTWLRVLEYGAGLALPDVTVMYVLHDGQVSSDRAAMRAAHRQVTDSYRARRWFSQAGFEQMDGALMLDELREAVSARDVESAAGILRQLAASPNRVRGAVGIERHRRYDGWASGRRARDGRPTLLVAGAGPHGVEVGGQYATTVAERSLLANATRIARRPPARLMTNSKPLAVVAKVLGIEVIGA